MMVRQLSFVGRANVLGNYCEVSEDYKLGMTDVSLNTDRLGFNEILTIASGGMDSATLMKIITANRSLLLKEEAIEREKQEAVRMTYKANNEHKSTEYHREDYQDVEKKMFVKNDFSKKEDKEVNKSEQFQQKLKDIIKLQEDFIEKTIRDRPLTSKIKKAEV